MKNKLRIKSILLCIASFWLCINVLFAQTPTVQDCLGAIPVCRDLYAQNNSFSGTGNYPVEINGANSCLTTGEVNDVWYMFTVISSGNLSFTIIPNNSEDDYDWAVYNLTNAHCNDIFFNPSLEVSCNYESNNSNNGITGPNGGNDVQEESVIPVQAGQTYVINVSNYSSSQNGYTLTFAASSASIYDNLIPELTGFESDPNCTSSSLYINFSENIMCNSIDVSDFELNGPNGSIPIINIISDICDAGGEYDNQFELQLNGLLNTSGNYSLELIGEVKDLCNNTLTDAELFFSINAPEASLNTNNAECGLNSGSASITMTSGESPFTFQWDDPNNQTTSFASNLYAGTYNCLITDNQGCQLNISAWIPNNNPVIANADPINHPNCHDTNDGSITMNVTNGIPPYSFLWDDPSNQTTATASNLAQGTYTVQISSGNDCVSYYTYTLTNPDSLTLTSSDDTLICFGDFTTLTVNASGGTSPYTYLWNNSATTFNSLNVSPTSNTTYITQIIDNNGCFSSTDTINIFLNTPIQASITNNDTSLCPGEPLTINVEASGGINGPYYYDFGQGYGVENSFSYITYQDTTITVSITDDCPSITGFANYDIDIIEQQMMDYTSSVTSGCEPLSVDFSLNMDTNKIQYINWKADSEIISSAFNFTGTLPADSCIHIILEIVDTNNCFTRQVDSCALTVFPLPKTSFSTIPESATILNPFFKFIDLTDTASTWHWDFGDGSTSNEQYPLHVYPDTGKYNVCLTTTNYYGCEKTMCADVFIDYIFTLYVPSAFSPNNDGINDFLILDGDGFDHDSFNMRIFNQWGEMVYETNNHLFQWDGYYKNRLLPEDIYVYRIRLIDFRGDEHFIDGFFLLVQ